jgi:hypothetical protein
MSQDWMINVLQDLRKFATQNGLRDLAEQLDDTIHIAVAETTAKACDCATPKANARPNRTLPGASGAL